MLSQMRKVKEGSSSRVSGGNMTPTDILIQTFWAPDPQMTKFFLFSVTILEFICNGHYKMLILDPPTIWIGNRTGRVPTAQGIWVRSVFITESPELSLSLLFYLFHLCYQWSPQHGEERDQMISWPPKWEARCGTVLKNIWTIPSLRT